MVSCKHSLIYLPLYFNPNTSLPILGTLRVVFFFFFHFICVLFCVNVCVYGVCMYVHQCMWISEEAGGQCWVSSSMLFTLLFETDPLTEPGVHVLTILAGP